ncbi:MAG: tetratricopeptide repeat-containing sulfotransferase family protein [Gammaproteobacteria bacterium]
MPAPKSEVAMLLANARDLIRSGRLDEARLDLLQASELAPEDPMPLQRLANVSLRQGDWRGARQWLERLSSLCPKDATVHTRLGLVCHLQGKLTDAEAAYKRALALDARSGDALAGLGRVAMVRGSVPDAHALFERALSIEPGHADATTGLAGLLENRGDADEALSLLKPLIEKGVVNSELVRIFAGASRQLDDTVPAVRLIDTLLKNRLPDSERAALLFILAGLRDASGMTDEAFQAADEANRLLPGRFDPGDFKDHADKLITAFPAGVAAGLGDGASTAPMVFVVGIPRSGTTLAEQILAQHPAVLAVGEHSRLEKMADNLEALSGHPWEQAIGDDASTHIGALAESYLAPLGEIPDSIRVVTDKMPVNFLYLPLVARVFPRAKVIWCRRDPLDVGLSCYLQAFGGRGVEFANDLNHIGHYIRQSDRLMRHWCNTLGLPVYELQYEKMVTDPESGTREMLGFLDLEWDDRCLRFHESKRYVGSPSYAQVRKPISAAAVGKSAPYEKHLAPLRRSLTATPGTD